MLHVVNGNMMVCAGRCGAGREPSSTTSFNALVLSPSYKTCGSSIVRENPLVRPLKTPFDASLICKLEEISSQLM